MLSIIGMVTANDAYGPIVDNARGLSEMSGLGDEVLRVTDELDAAGNTAKAITKGFSIGAAGLTVIALLAAYRETLMNILGDDFLKGFDILDPLVFFGMLVGVGVPAVFSAMLMMGVNRNADRMVNEIHRQFDEIPGLKEGQAGVEPDYNRCIDIATVGALKELLPAGIMAIGVTLLVGFIGGVYAIAGYLAGNILSGVLLALLMSNAGGMWDNAKKYVEAGNCGGKGSPAHKATIIGDTVGDPFKDTAGPSINTQITVVSLVSSLAAGLFDLPSVNEITVDGDTFHGVMHDEKSGKDYDIINGKIDGNHFTLETSMSFVVFSINVDLEGTLSEDGKTIEGTVTAMSKTGSFEGEKIE